MGRVQTTKPSTVDSKLGTTGDQIKLQANYFRLKQRPNWQIYRYHVEFKPEVHNERLRNALIFSQKEMIGGYLFDGTQLFLTRKLESDRVEKTVKGRIDNEEYMLVIKFTGLVSMSESQSIQVLKYDKSQICEMCTFLTQFFVCLDSRFVQSYIT